jgi:hypothetical protein
MSNNIRVDDREKIEQLKQDYSRQYQQSKMEKMLSSVSPADQEVVKSLQMLDNMCGNRLIHLFNVYMTIKNQRSN